MSWWFQDWASFMVRADNETRYHDLLQVRAIAFLNHLNVVVYKPDGHVHFIHTQKEHDAANTVFLGAFMNYEGLTHFFELVSTDPFSYSKLRHTAKIIGFFKPNEP
jgi:hypothetical protein